MKLVVFKWRIRNLNAPLSQQRLPLLNAKTLAGRSVVNAGHYRKNTHVIEEVDNRRYLRGQYKELTERRPTAPVSSLWRLVRDYPDRN